MRGQTGMPAPSTVPAVSPARRRRIRGGLKLLALLVVVAFVVWYVAANWADVLPVLHTMTPWRVTAALVCAAAGVFASMLSWRAVLTGMGSRLAMRPASRVFFLGQLGKYVPGSIWPIVAQAELSKEYGTPRTRGAAALMVQMLVSIVVGTVFAAACLGASSRAAVVQYWWLLLIAAAGAVCLVPPVFRRIAVTACRLVRRPTDELAALGAPALLRASGWSLAMWVLFGLHLAVLAGGVVPSSVRLVLVSAGGYALAWLVGFVIVFLPAGAGAREAALALALAPVMSAPAAVGIALVSRFVMLAVDLVLAGSAVLAQRTRRRKGHRVSQRG